MQHWYDVSVQHWCDVFGQDRFDVLVQIGEGSQGRIDKRFHGNTDEGYQGCVGGNVYTSAAEGSPGSTSNIYNDAVSTIKMFPINFRHNQMFS